MTSYQSIVKAYLLDVFGKSGMQTNTMLIQVSEREMVNELSIKNGWVPVWGPVEVGEYTTFHAIALFYAN